MPPPFLPPQATTRPTASNTPTTRTRSPETHESLHRRNVAAEILQSYEMLSWFALDRNEVRSSDNTASSPLALLAHTRSTIQSLAQTRLHFLSQLAGFTEEDEQAQVTWKPDTTPHNLNALPTSIYTGLLPLGGEGRRKSSTAGKGKERASLGGGGRASPGGARASLGGEGSAGGSGKKTRKSAGVGS